MEDDTDNTDITAKENVYGIINPEENIDYFDINRLELIYSKKDMNKLRAMWDDIFADSQEFTDYYFDNICKENEILVAYYEGEPIGMVHINSYRLRVYGRELDCKYIVGVAVREQYRKNGVMKRMITRIKDDYSKLSGFLFLMPDNEDYYRGSGFVKIYENWVVEFNILSEDVVEERCYKEYQAGALSVSELTEYDEVALEELARNINEFLDNRYKIYSIRDGKYLNDMLMQYLAENGNVCVVRSESEEIIGLFAFGIWDGMLYAERVEVFNGSIYDMFTCILQTCIDNACVGCVVTVAHDDIKQTLPDIQGLDIQFNEGHGIMAYIAPEMEKKFGIKSDDLINRTFLDEIV
ncbi:MAG: GNAT family N-acetyltransferase [Wujia sp.]